MCGNTNDQSPIDIVTAHVTEDHNLEDLGFHVNDNMYSTVSGPLIYDMKTWQFNVPQGAAGVQFQGKDYGLSQFHFHSPSENTVDGVHGALELHYVNTAADGHILVVAMLWDVGEESALITHLESVTAPQFGDDTPVTLPNPYQFTESGEIDLSYDHYTGSLTTPPCTNGTEWVVLRHRPTLTAEHLARFRTAMSAPTCNMVAVHENEYPVGIPHAVWDPSIGVNNRPTQPMGGRAVARHTYSAPHSTQLAADAIEPNDVFLAEQADDAEQPPRRILAALSCFSLLSAAMGVVFLRRRIRGGQDGELLSHFVEISD